MSQPPQQPGHQGQPGQQGQPWQQPGQPQWQAPQAPNAPAPYSGQQPGQQPHWQQAQQPWQQQPYAQAYAPPGAPASQGRRPAGRAAKVIGWLLVAFAVLIGIGSWGPWVTSDLFDLTGFGDVTWHDDTLAAAAGDPDEGADGILTVVLAGVLLVPAVLRGFGVAPRAMAIVAFFPAALVALIALIDYLDVSSQENQALLGELSIGWGLWLVLIGGVLATLTAVAGIFKAR